MRSEHYSISKKNDEWISDESTPDPTGLRPLSYRVIVRPVSVKRKTKGGILLPDSTISDMEFLTTVGRVLAIGPLAFTRPDMLTPVIDENGIITGHKYDPWFKVGDYITYGKFAGAKRIFKGVKVLILNEDEALDVIDNPHDIDPSYNLSSGE